MVWRGCAPTPSVSSSEPKTKWLLRGVVTDHLQLHLYLVPVLVVAEYVVPRDVEQAYRSVRIKVVRLDLEVGRILQTAPIKIVASVDHEFGRFCFDCATHLLCNCIYINAILKGRRKMIEGVGVSTRHRIRSKGTGCGERKKKREATKKKREEKITMTQKCILKPFVLTCGRSSACPPQSPIERNDAPPLSKPFFFLNVFFFGF